MWEESYISEYWKVLLRWTDRNVWADEEGTGWAWTVTFGRGKGKRTSKIIPGSKNDYGKSRAYKERRISDYQSCKISEVYISVRTGNTVFKNLRM